VPGRGLAIAVTAITQHNPDLGTLFQLNLIVGSLPIGQQRHNPSPLQLTDNRSVAVVPLESPIICAHNDQMQKLAHELDEYVAVLKPVAVVREGGRVPDPIIG
jgi:hypothetical protein